MIRVERAECEEQKEDATIFADEKDDKHYNIRFYHELLYIFRCHFSIFKTKSYELEFVVFFHVRQTAK